MTRAERWIVGISIDLGADGAGMQMETVTTRGVAPDAFRPWLIPLSVRYWQAIHDFWEQGILIPILRPE